MEVSTADLAVIFGITKRRIQQLANAGVLKRLAHGTWDLPAAVQSFVAHQVESEVRKVQRTHASGDDRLKNVKARREELGLAKDERELIPLADAVFAMDRVAGTVALEMNNVPARFSRDLDVRDRLQAEIDDALIKVADSVAQCAQSLRSGSEPDPSEDEDHA